MATAGKAIISRKTVGRLSLYRRLLTGLSRSGAENVFSHQLAHLAGVSAAQVRRDFMVIGYTGRPNRGYQVDTCLATIERLLDGPAPQDVALVGVGRLGRSLLCHFAGRRSLLRIAAGFDVDPLLIGTSIEGCPIYDIGRLAEVVGQMGIRVAVLAVPPEVAQEAAEALVKAGVRSLVDFTATCLRLPDDVFVDHMDITSALESAAFFARSGDGETDEEQVGRDADEERAAEASDSLPVAVMKLDQLAAKIGARVLTPGPMSGAEVARVYAGDRVSDLLNVASDKTLLVTNLANVQMVKVAELMEVPGICFVDNVEPEADLVELARANDTFLMVSPLGVFETCGLVYQALAGNTAENGEAGK